MIQLRRRNTAWLVALGLLIGLALLAAPVPPATQVALIGILLVAMVASSLELGKDNAALLNTLRRAPVLQRVSPDAKEASERAKTRGGYQNQRLMMLDLGVIASQATEGLTMRRTRSLSRDDDGVRPFLTLHVDPQEAERNTIIRFEIYNESGQQEYVHEMRPYLREGEVTIMADYHLPLAGNRNLEGMGGDWDMRVYVDGTLVGMHHFTVAPSVAERTRRLAGEQAVEPKAAQAPAPAQRLHTRQTDYDIIEEPPQNIPPRLGDLLGPEGGDNKPAGRPSSPRRRSS